MTTADRRSGGRARSGRRLGLSARLLILVLSFMTLAEVLIYVPSAIGFRRTWLNDRLVAAQMLALALDGMPPEARTPALEAKLLAGINGAQAIGVQGPGMRWLLVAADTRMSDTHRDIDLRIEAWGRSVLDLLRGLFAAPDPAVRVTGPGLPGSDGVELVEVIVSEAPLKAALLAFSRDFLTLTVLIAIVTGAALYLVLHLMVVRPVRRLSGNIAAFAANPEDSGRILARTGRTDEIGRAEDALASMETLLAGELRSKRHLADLGLAVSKINHELRNMLTTAQLLGDRLGEVQDPTVRRIAPRLIRTLHRAVEFCAATLAHGRASEREPERRRVRLRRIVKEQLDLVALAEGVEIAVHNRVPDELHVEVDAEQLARVFSNLLRNAVEALSRERTAEARIEIAAEQSGGEVRITVSDNGPGVPARVRDRLFTPFQSSDKSGGTGLGLPIASELVRLHGGRLALVERTGPGAAFAIALPDRPGPGSPA